MPDNIFNLYGLTYQATLYLLFFISVAIIAHIEKDMASIINVMVVFLAFVPAVWSIYLIVDWLAEKQTLFEPAGDYTYFGEALFGKSLKHEHNFSSAFYAAKKAIETRETGESMESSMSQIKMGKDIEKQLLLFTDRLD